MFTQKEIPQSSWDSITKLRVHRTSRKDLPCQHIDRNSLPLRGPFNVFPSKPHRYSCSRRPLRASIMPGALKGGIFNWSDLQQSKIGGSQCFYENIAAAYNLYQDHMGEERENSPSPFSWFYLENSPPQRDKGRKKERSLPIFSLLGLIGRVVSIGKTMGQVALIWIRATCGYTLVFKILERSSHRSFSISCNLILSIKVDMGVSALLAAYCPAIMLPSLSWTSSLGAWREGLKC